MKYVLLLLLLTGCVTTEELESHRASVQAWKEVELARASAQANRFAALVEVAKRGDTTALVGVTFAVSGNGGGLPVQASPLPSAPDAEARAFRWASLILPNATTIAIAGFGARVQMNASDNARMASEYSYGAMASIGTTGMGTTRDVALAGFNTFAAMPPSSQTTTNVTLGNGSQAAWGESSQSFDLSRRCAHVMNMPGSVSGTTPYVTGSQLAPC